MTFTSTIMSGKYQALIIIDPQRTVTARGSEMDARMAAQILDETLDTDDVWLLLEHMLNNILDKGESTHPGVEKVKYLASLL